MKKVRGAGKRCRSGARLSAQDHREEAAKTAYPAAPSHTRATDLDEKITLNRRRLNAFVNRLVREFDPVEAPRARVVLGTNANATGAGS